MIKRDDAIGLELDFMAVDSCRNVALFSSAGFGAIPVSVLEAISSPVMEEEFLASVERSTLPKRSLDRWAFPKKCNWDHVLSKGIFVYDYDDWSGCYIRPGKPRAPICLDQLDETLKTFALLVDMSEISFNNKRVIHLEKHVPCD